MLRDTSILFADKCLKQKSIKINPTPGICCGMLIYLKFQTIFCLTKYVRTEIKKTLQNTHKIQSITYMAVNKIQI